MYFVLLSRSICCRISPVSFGVSFFLLPSVHSRRICIIALLVNPTFFLVDLCGTVSRSTACTLFSTSLMHFVSMIHCVTRISSVPEDTNSTSGGKKLEVNVGTRHASRRIALAPRFARRSCRLVHLHPSLLAALRLYLVLDTLGRLVERGSRYRLLASFRMSLSYH